MRSINQAYRPTGTVVDSSVGLHSYFSNAKISRRRESLLTFGNNSNKIYSESMRSILITIG